MRQKSEDSGSAVSNRSSSTGDFPSYPSLHAGPSRALEANDRESSRRHAVLPHAGSATRSDQIPLLSLRPETSLSLRFHGAKL